MFSNEADQKLPTVLLIDDDMVSREVIATLLTMNGYTVHTADSGLESLAMLDGGSCIPQVILMDAQMPGLSGGALIEQLRARSTGFLYAISGSDAPSEVMEGADGFLMKPFGPDALQQVLEKHVTKPEPSPVADAPVVNPTTLAQFRSVMPEKGVREIFAAIVVDLDKRHDLLVTAIEHDDPAEVRRIGHAIKGGCGMAGALQAMRVGELLETRGDDLDYSRSLLVDLKVASENLKRMLDAELSPQDSHPLPGD
jgi:CheY-like chemotaxis protein/HPt (histidine-containing phosphotransfer) domain-containing protein